MRFSSRFFLYGPFFLFVALALGVMTYWWFAAEALSKRLDALNGHEIVPGVHMHFGSKRIAGFPFRLDVIFGDFSLETDGARGPIVWRTRDFATHTLSYTNDVTILESAGPQDVSWTSDTGAHRDVRITPGALRASAVIENGKLVRFDVDGISLSAPDFAFGRAQFHLRRDPAYDALDLVVDLQSVRFAGDAGAGFANGLSRMRLEGRLAPALPFAPALEGKSDWRNALEAWRGDRGAFKVDEAAAFWGKCEATSSGAVALDELHRIKGSLSFSLADCDALGREAAGIVARPGAHRAVLSVLADLAGREKPDKSGALPVTVVFKDGLIYLGPGKSLGSESYFEPVGLLHALY